MKGPDSPLTLSIVAGPKGKGLPGTQLLLRPAQPKPKRRLPKPIQRVRTAAEAEEDARSDREIMEWASGSSLLSGVG